MLLSGQYHGTAVHTDTEAFKVCTGNRQVKYDGNGRSRGNMHGADVVCSDTEVCILLM